MFNVKTVSFHLNGVNLTVSERFGFNPVFEFKISRFENRGWRIEINHNGKAATVIWNDYRDESETYKTLLTGYNPFTGYLTEECNSFLEHLIAIATWWPNEKYGYEWYTHEIQQADYNFMKYRNPHHHQRDSSYGPQL